MYPKNRQDREKSRAIDEHTAENLICLRKSMPRATVPALIKIMERRRLVSPGTRLKATTVYRFLHSQKLMRPPAGHPDRRKFEAELPNDLWQSDVMHGPLVAAEPRQKKSYLIAFLDDHSRLVPYARFYLSEKLEDFLDAFEQALLKRGLPRKLYVDNGAAYRSRHLEHFQMPEVSSKPVKLPYDKHIASSKRLEAIFQARPIIIFAGSLVVVYGQVET